LNCFELHNSYTVQFSRIDRSTFGAEYHLII
jgi:hypothetical protein